MQKNLACWERKHNLKISKINKRLTAPFKNCQAFYSVFCYTDIMIPVYRREAFPYDQNPPPGIPP